MWARVSVCMPQNASIGQRTTCFNQFPSFLCGSEFGSSGLAAGASIHRPIFLTHSGFVLNVPVKTKFNLKDKKKKLRSPNQDWHGEEQPSHPSHWTTRKSWPTTTESTSGRSPTLVWSLLRDRHSWLPHCLLMLSELLGDCVQHLKSLVWGTTAHCTLTCST